MVKRLLVVGGGGFVGSHVAALAERSGWAVTTTTTSGRSGSVALDLSSVTRVREVVAALRPHVVVNAAAVVDGAPTSAGSARAVNVDGAAHLAAAASEAGAHLVHVSSDCVHAGREAPYPDEASPTPLAWAYALEKAEAETAVVREHTGASIVRPSVVLGTGSRHVHHDGAYFSDMVRQPVHVADLAALLLACAQQAPAGTINAGGETEVDRLRLAMAFARAAGADPGQVRAASLVDAGLARPATLRLESTRARALGVRLRGVEEYLPLR